MKKLLGILALVLCLSMIAGTCAMAEDAPALLAYYTFDDADNLGADASGNGNDLVTAIAPDGIQAAEGCKDGGVYFGGVSGLLAKDGANDDFIDTYTGKGITVSLWAKVDLENAREGNARVVSHGIQGSDEGFVLLVNKATNDGKVSVFNISKVGGSDWWGSYGAVAEELEGWHQYVMVYDPENSLVVTFIDGEKAAEVYADEEEKLASAFTFCVGGSWAQWDWFNGGNHEEVAEGFIGTVDEVKVFAGAVYDLELINQ